MIKVDYNKEGIRVEVGEISKYNPNVPFRMNIKKHVSGDHQWGTDLNNDTKVNDFAKTLAKYAVRLRGFTCYPDGSRGGQPLNIVPYEEALQHEGKEFKEQFHDICEIGQKGGTCGI